MAYPTGVTLRTVTFGAAFDLISGDNLIMRATIYASRSMVWAANGFPAIGGQVLQHVYNGSSGLEASEDLPITDQNGWHDGNGNAIDVSDGKQSHLYQVVLEYISPVTNKVVLTNKGKWIALPEGDGTPVDLDDLIPVSSSGGTTIFIPDEWSSQIVDLETRFATLKAWARNLDQLIVGEITRDANGAATSAPVKWPDETAGTYTADTLSTAFPGAVDAYHVTYGDPPTMTVTQPLMTRDPATGAVTNLPELVVS